MAGTPAPEVSDRLSLRVAEQILRDAIALHDRERFTEAEIEWHRIEHIGDELGIDRRILHQALADLEIETESDRFLERVLAPHRIGGAKLAIGDPAHLRHRLDAWMEALEDLVPSRRSGAVISSIRAVSDGRQLVEVFVDTRPVRTRSIVTLLVWFVAALATGIGVAATAGGMLLGTAAFMASVASLGAIGVAAAHSSAKWHLRRIRRGLDRLLAGLVDGPWTLPPMTRDCAPT